MRPSVDFRGGLFHMSLLFFLPHSTTATGLTTWINNPLPANSTLTEEIQCYSLPYGGIGFISHLITYYTMAMLSLSRRPCLPFLPNHHSHLDMLLSALSLLATVTISTLTIIRCRSRWQFVAIAAWKLSLSISYGVLCFHAAAIVDNGKRVEYGEIELDGLRSVHVLFWLILYVPGVGVGLTGLFSLIAETMPSNHKVMAITAAFGSITLAISVVVGLVVCFVLAENSRRGMVVTPMIGSGLAFGGVVLGCVGVLSALYNDWVLGAIAGNMLGAPSGDNMILYWSYFAAKSLPFFSS